MGNKGGDNGGYFIQGKEEFLGLIVLYRLYNCIINWIAVFSIQVLVC